MKRTVLLFGLLYCASLVLCAKSPLDEFHHYQRGREILLHRESLWTAGNPSFFEEGNKLRRFSEFADDTAHQWLIQLRGPIEQAHKENVEKFIGQKLGTYFPHNTFLLYATREVAERASNAPGVLWVGAFLPEYKHWDTSKMDSSEFLVQTVPGENLLRDSKAVASLQEALYGIAEVSKVSDDKAHVKVTRGSNLEVLDRLKFRPEVHWIEPVMEYKAHNQYAKEVVQSKDNGNPFTDAGLNGEEQIVGLADSGIDFNSCYLSNGANPSTDTVTPTARKIVRYVTTYGDFQDADGHGTSVAGTIAGQSTNAGPSEQWNGIASGAKIHFTDISTAANVLTPPASITPIFNTARTDGARIFVTSFGAAATWYNSYSQEIDSFTLQYSDFLVIVSAGNEGTERSLSSLAVSKNALVVGASQSSVAGIGGTPPDFAGPDTLATFSSRGPTPDGRLKPDVVAPGQKITSALNGQACSQDGGREGTSYAAGVVGGAAAIARQYLTLGYYPLGFPSGVNEYTSPTSHLLKALLINSGQPLAITDSNGQGHFVSLTNDFPSPLQGFGRVQLDQALYLPNATYGTTRIFARSNTETLGTNQGLRYCFSVSEGVPTPYIKATLVWNDPPSSPAAGHMLVNNLDLVIIDQTGREWRTDTAPKGEFDAFNNVEQVTLRGPAPGIYAVYVWGFNVPSGPQTFSLVVSGNATFVPNCAGFDTAGERVCPNHCSGFGTCNPNFGMCNCNSGRLGVDCSVVPCPNNCAPNGVCDYETGTCVCGSNYAGPDCNSIVNTVETDQETAPEKTPVEEGIAVGTFAAVVVVAFIIGGICSVIVGFFLAVKYLEYKRDQAKGGKEHEME